MDSTGIRSSRLNHSYVMNVMKVVGIKKNAAFLYST